MAQDDLDHTAPQIPQYSSAIGEESGVARAQPTVPATDVPAGGEAPAEAHPTLQHPTEPSLSEEEVSLPTHITSPPAEQFPISSELVYNNHVALDGVSGMEVDSQSSEADSTLGSSIGYALAHFAG